MTLTVSTGAGEVAVPDVANFSFEDAQQALTSAGFQVQRQDEANEDTDAGTVLRTDPAGGVSAPKGSIVTVFVSTGEEQIPIPDVRNLTADEAFTQLGDAGFAVREASEASSSIESGRVTRTDPAAGTAAARGSTVRMFVSSGSETVEVPEVRGQSESDAKAALSRARTHVEHDHAGGSGQCRQGGRAVTGRRNQCPTRQQCRAHDRNRRPVVHDHHDRNPRPVSPRVSALPDWYAQRGRHELPGARPATGGPCSCPR